jgi:hypothetical protein
MSHRVRELVERQARLQRRCAAERATIAGEIASIEARFAGVDRIAGLAGRVLLNPVVITGGVVALVTIGRARGMRIVGRLFLLTTAARRLLQTVRVVQGLSRTRSGGVSP